MARPIDADLLKDNVKSFAGLFADEGFMIDYHAVLNAIEAAPTCTEHTSVAEILEEIEHMLANDISYYQEQMSKNRAFYSAKHAATVAILNRITELGKKYVKE